MPTADGPRPSSDAAEAQSPLADQLVELSTITGGLAHEIRNPLSTLKVNLQLLDEDWRQIESPQPGGPEPQDVARRTRRRLRTLLAESQRLERILEDFLKYVGKRKLSTAPTDLNDIVRELADFFEPQTAAHQIDLKTTLAGAPVVCEVDRMVLKEALLNLLINAQQAIGDGGRIDLLVETRDRIGAIIVADNGPGVPGPERERIFAPYVSNKKGGSGLGLATARQILRQHGGALLLDENPGGGARFTVQLPLA